MPDIVRSKEVWARPFGMGQPIVPVDVVNTSLVGTGGVTDAAVSSVKSFIVSALEKQDTLIRTPLKDFSYSEDISIYVSPYADWRELISYEYEDYRLTNGAGDGPVQAGMSTEVPIQQVDWGKSYFKTHLWEVDFRVNYFDLQKGIITNRSIENALSTGIRVEFDAHLNLNTYVGLPQYGTRGLMNQTGAVATNVAAGAAGTTQWSTKTPQEITADIANAIYDHFEASGRDRTALANHITMPYKQLAYISQVGSSDLMQQTIKQWLENNNFAVTLGGSIKFTGNPFAAGAGAGGTDRMAIYNDNPRFLEMQILAPLTRIMTDSNTEKRSYDSAFAANISEVMLYYPETLRYYDGI